MESMIGVLVPMMVFAIPLLAIWTRHQQKIAEMQVNATAQSTAEKAAQYASHVQQLEERVRVLERIVTDSGYNVASQIDALRDVRRIEDNTPVKENVQ